MSKMTREDAGYDVSSLVRIPMIKVKALEFVRLGDRVFTAPVGVRDFYDVYLDPVTNMWYWESSGIRVDNKRYSLADAKAACQAHHTQHVLSMIEGEG